MRKQLMALLMVCSYQLATAQDTLAPLVADYLQRAYQLTRSAEFEAALELDHQALNLYESYPFRDDSLLADVYNDISVQHYYLGDFKEAIHWMEKVLSTREPLYGDSSTQIAMAYNNIGVFHYHRGDYRNASEFYQQALAIYALVGDEKNYHLSECYSNVGACCAMMGDYGMAKEYFEKALSIRTVLGNDVNPKLLVNVYKNLGVVYEQIGEYNLSLNYLEKVLEFRETYQKNDYYGLADIHNSIGVVKAKTGKFEDAIKHYNKSISLRSYLPKGSRFENFVSYYNLGERYLELSWFTKAEEAYNKSKKILLENFSHNDPEVLGVRLREVNLLKERKQIQEALNDIEEIIIQYKASDTIVDLFQLPSLPVYLDMLKLQEELYRLLWRDKNEVNFLLQAINSGRKILDLLDHMRFSYEGEISRLTIIEENITQYESHIQNCLDAYNITDDPDYLNETFYTAERAQCRQLLEEARRQQATVYASIPEDIQEELREQAISLTNLEDKIDGYNADLLEADTQLMKFMDQRFDLKQKRKTLLERIEKEYPVFYQMLYDESVVDLDYIQSNLLSPDQALLSYFQGEDRYYLFFLDSRKLHLYPLAKTHVLEDKISKYRSLLTQPLASSELRDTLNRISFELYRELIAPVAKDLPQRLIIIPGGKLALLPFESLIQQPEGTHTDYLVQKHSFTYIYSATWWKSLANSTETQKGLSSLLAIAPDFKESMDQSSVGEVRFASLEYYQSEVETLQTIVGGKVLQNQTASLTNFLKEAGDYRLLHLATHAVLDGDDSYLAFSSDGGNSRLYLSQIYNLELNAEMVVLSACETGLGNFRQGEGIFSLARAFSYAGAQSLVPSLWQVEDRATTRIMQEFYQQIRKGISKDVALQRAQIQFLQNCRKSETQPYHWAAFVPYGLMNPVEFEHFGSGNWLAAIFIGVFLMVISVIFYKRKTT